MTWTRPALRDRFRFGINWRKREAARESIAAAASPGPAALAGLDGPEETMELDLEGSDLAQVKQKVAILRRMVIGPAFAQGPRGLEFVRRILAEILGAAPPGINSNRKPWLAAYLFSWIKARIRYVNDPDGVEIFTQFPDILARGYGDCDDLTVVVAVLLRAVGIPVRARVIQTPKAPGWSHVYPVAWLDGDWRGFDASVPTSRPGWEYPKRTAVLDLELAP